MMYFLQTPILKIDAMYVISGLALLVSLFAFVITYNKAIKNSVNKSDMDDMEKNTDTKIRAVHYRIDEVKKDNSEDHERIRKETFARVASMENKIEKIYEYILSKNGK